MILPLTILRRLDCILEPDLETVRALAAKYDNPNRLKIEVNKATGRPFYNTSNYSFANLLKDADGLADNLAGQQLSAITAAGGFDTRVETQSAADPGLVWVSACEMLRPESPIRLLRS